MARSWDLTRPRGCINPSRCIFLVGFGIQPVARFFGKRSHHGVRGYFLLPLLTPWLLGVYDAQGIAFFDNFIVRHNDVNAFLGKLTRTRRAPAIYVFVMPLVLLPYSGLVVANSVENS